MTRIEIVELVREVERITQNLAEEYFAELDDSTDHDKMVYLTGETDKVQWAIGRVIEALTSPQTNFELIRKDKMSTFP